jgi:glucose-fructose oxidoreductase
MQNLKFSRRAFLQKTSYGAMSAIAMPYVITTTALGNQTTPPASERIALGHIGVGNQGSGVLTGFLGTHGSQSIAVCDAFTDRRQQRAKQIDEYYSRTRGKDDYHACAMFEDFRELLARRDIDAVVIAAPDHWHVPIAMEAARQGKDMYVEKPLSTSIEQNKSLRAAIHRYGNIFQYGTQQRSFNTHCAFACELVRNGYLGKIKEIHVLAPGGNSGGSTKPIPVPEGFNYDLWLGPAQVSPYTADRCTNYGTWFVYDNSLGFIAGWGAHPLDIMHWGYPQIPVEYEGTGVIPTEGLFDTITRWNIKGKFADGIPFSFKDGSDRTTFVGENGWVAASRNGIESNPNSLLSIKLKAEDIRLLQANNHYQNFVDAIKSRRSPASPIDSAVQSDFVSHLSNIAVRTGRKIMWDPITETIVGDTMAQRMTIRSLRAPWAV